MSDDETFMNVCVCLVIVFVLVMITAPRKGDSEQTRITRQIARQTLTVTLGLVVAFALFALWVVKHK